MGEIKSTIELMMERTKGLSLSEDEKKEFKRQELQKKAKGIHLKLVQTPTLLPSLLEDMQHNDESDADTLQVLLWNTFVENIPCGKDVSEYVSLMRKLPVSSRRMELLRELENELSDQVKKRAKERKAAITAERKRLAVAGIEGTAVVPKLKNDLDYNKDIIDKYKKILILDIN